MPIRIMFETFTERAGRERRKKMEKQEKESKCKVVNANGQLNLLNGGRSRKWKNCKLATEFHICTRSSKFRFCVMSSFGSSGYQKECVGALFWQKQWEMKQYVKECNKSCDVLKEVLLKVCKFGCLHRIKGTSELKDNICKEEESLHLNVLFKNIGEMCTVGSKYHRCGHHDFVFNFILMIVM